MRIPPSIEEKVKDKLPCIRKSLNDFYDNPTIKGAEDTHIDMRMIDIKCGRTAYMFFAKEYDEKCPPHLNLRYLTHL